jgi:hypothetical protein
MAFLLPLLKIIWSIAKIQIPLPLGLIVAAVAAWYGLGWWDTTSAVKKAVEARVHEMVTGAEKEKLQAQLAESQRQAARFKAASDDYKAKMDRAQQATATLEKARAQEDQDDAETARLIAELEERAKSAARAHPDCPVDVIDTDIFRKLHNNR